MRDPELPSPFGAFLWYLFVGMRRDVRGLVAVLLILGAMIMMFYGIMLWGVVAALIGLGLLVANGRSL